VQKRLSASHSELMQSNNRLYFQALVKADVRGTNSQSRAPRLAPVRARRAVGFFQALSIFLPRSPFGVLLRHERLNSFRQVRGTARRLSLWTRSPFVSGIQAMAKSDDRRNLGWCGETVIDLSFGNALRGFHPLEIPAAVGAIPLVVIAHPVKRPGDAPCARRGHHPHQPR
jgi:hypothetical protein